jgi:hypothetical protein
MKILHCKIISHLFTYYLPNDPLYALSVIVPSLFNFFYVCLLVGLFKFQYGVYSYGDKLGKIKYLWSNEEMIDDINLDIGCL